MLSLIKYLLELGRVPAKRRLSRDYGIRFLIAWARSCQEAAGTGLSLQSLQEAGKGFPLASLARHVALRIAVKILFYEERIKKITQKQIIVF